MQAEGWPPPFPDGLVRQFRIEAGLESVRDVMRLLRAGEPLLALTAEDRSTAEIVLAEVLNNVVEHAYAMGSGPILLTLSLGDGLLFCRVEDEGAIMPGGTPPAGCPPDPADLPEGGFGWHLIRTLARDLRYERSEGVNRLCFALPAERSIA